MKSVSILIRPYKIRYIQKPYDNRYYVISKLYKNKKEEWWRDIQEIPCQNDDILEIFFNGLKYGLEDLELVDVVRRIDDFMYRVEEKNKWLERND